MNKISRRNKHLRNVALMVFAGLMIASFMFGVPVFAESMCGGAPTAIINCDENEGGIWHIINLVIEILSIGIGIMGVIGISVAGVQFMTAKDSPEQAKKAKNRILEIVLGLAVYAVLFGLLEWLLPDGVMDTQSDVQTAGSTTQVQEMEKRQEEAREQINSIIESSADNNSQTPVDTRTKAQQISETAWAITNKDLSYSTVAKATGYYDYMDENCHKIGGGDCDRGKTGYNTFCSGFVYNVIRYTGVDPNYPMKLTGKQLEYANGSSRWQNVTSKVGGKTSKLKPGDVLIKKGGGHTLLITEDANGQLYTAQAAVTNFPPKKKKVASSTLLDDSAGNLSKYEVFRIVE